MNATPSHHHHPSPSTLKQLTRRIHKPRRVPTDQVQSRQRCSIERLKLQHRLSPPGFRDVALIQQGLVVREEGGSGAGAGILSLDHSVGGEIVRGGRDGSVRVDVVATVQPADDGFDAVRILGCQSRHISFLRSIRQQSFRLCRGLGAGSRRKRRAADCAEGKGRKRGGETNHRRSS